MTIFEAYFIFFVENVDNRGCMVSMNNISLFYFWT